MSASVSVTSSSSSTPSIIELNSVNANSNSVLFSFHCVGGNGRFMKPDAKYFEDLNVRIFGVNTPGRNNDQDAMTSIGALVDFLYPQIKLVLQRLKAGNPNLKIFFFGHSMGGILAFEVARSFEQDVDQESLMPILSISNLIVSAVRDPFKLSTFNAEPNNSLLNYKKSDEQIKINAIRLGGLPPGVHPLFLQKAIPVMRKDYEALERYNESRQMWGGTKLSCPISVFIGDMDVYVHENDMKYWHMWTSASCSKKHFGGGHFYFSEGHIKSEFLNAIRDIIVPSSVSSLLQVSPALAKSNLRVDGGFDSDTKSIGGGFEKDPATSDSKNSDSKGTSEEESIKDMERRGRTMSIVDSKK